jgi:hypothetical protein
MRALTDPFGLYETNEEVCIPDITTVPSYKIATQNRATFQIGTNGTGFCFHRAGVFGNNEPCVWFTESAFTGITISKTGTGVSNAPDSRFPYTNTAVRHWRLVGSGLRIRYAGTELNRGGSIVAWNNKDEDPVNADQTILLGITGSVRHAPNRSWKTVAYYPSDPRAMDFDWQKEHAGDQYLGFMVTGEPGNTFEWERVSFYELVPTADHRTPTTTASDSDILGLSHVRNYLGHINLEMFGPEVYHKGLRFVTDSVLRSSGFPTLTNFGL